MWGMGWGGCVNNCINLIPIVITSYLRLEKCLTMLIFNTEYSIDFCLVLLEAVASHIVLAHSMLDGIVIAIHSRTGRGSM